MKQANYAHVGKVYPIGTKFILLHDTPDLPMGSIGTLVLHKKENLLCVEFLGTPEPKIPEDFWEWRFYIKDVKNFGFWFAEYTLAQTPINN